MHEHKFSLNWPLGRFSLLVAMSVCVSVLESVTIQNTHFQVSWRLLVEGCNANIGLLTQFFFFFPLQ